MKKLGDTDFAFIADNAHRFGVQAGRDCAPIPMRVIDGKTVYNVDTGACGFAWVHFAGNTAWGRWAKATGIARADYPRGLCVWVREFGQSVERKSAYAAAYAKVLKANGIDCYAADRLD